VAATVYRYRGSGPPLTALRTFVPGAIVQGTISPAPYVDITCDSSYKTDLDDYMSTQGFTYDSTAPTTTTAQASASSDSNKRLLEKFINAPSEGWPTGVYKETTGTVFPTAIIWWTSSGKTAKIMEKDITWTGASPTTIVSKMYAADGSTVISTITDTITYSGPFETSRSRTIA
jgi:hypothetical protein